MTRTARKVEPFDIGAWPALTAFFRGYLHEDAEHEHRSMAAAFEAFWTEAGDEERRRFSDEWQALMTMAGKLSWARTRSVLEELGARWTPGGRAGFSALRRSVHEKSRLP